MSFLGRYFSGANTTPENVSVRVTSAGLVIEYSDGRSVTWPWREVRLARKSASGDPVNFVRGGELPETLVVPDERILSEIHVAAPSERERFPRPASPRRQLTYAAVGAALFLGILVAGYFQVLPRLAEVASHRIPVEWEEALGKTVATELAPAHLRCEDPELVAAVESIVERLAAAAPAHPYRFRVAIVRREEVNALAAPGGYVVLFTGLLEKTKTPEELAGVLAHELQHVLQRHSTKSLLRRASAGFLIAIATGDGGTLAQLLQTAEHLGALAYGRSDEEEADREGMQLLEAARIDPEGMVSFFHVLESEGKELPAAISYLSSHPRTERRIATLRAMADASDAEMRPIETARPWPELVSRCGQPDTTRHP